MVHWQSCSRSKLNSPSSLNSTKWHKSIKTFQGNIIRQECIYFYGRHILKTYLSIDAAKCTISPSRPQRNGSPRLLHLFPGREEVFKLVPNVGNPHTEHQPDRPSPNIRTGTWQCKLVSPETLFFPAASYNSRNPCLRTGAQLSCTASLFLHPHGSGWWYQWEYWRYWYYHLPKKKKRHHSIYYTKF
jgi:hypothetical protein